MLAAFLRKQPTFISVVIEEIICRIAGVKLSVCFYYSRFLAICNFICPLLPPRPFCVCHIFNKLILLCLLIPGAALASGGVDSFDLGYQRAAAVIDFGRWAVWVAWVAAAVGELFVVVHDLAVEHGVGVAGSSVECCHPLFSALDSHFLSGIIGIQPSGVLRARDGCAGRPDGAVAVHGGDTTLQIICHALEASAL